MVERLLYLATGSEAGEWAGFGQLGWGRRLELIGNGMATVLTFGGTALVRKSFDNPTAARVGQKVGDFVLELLTSGTE